MFRRSHLPLGNTVMRLRKYAAWHAMKEGKTVQLATQPAKETVLSNTHKKILRQSLVGGQLHWIDSWADGIIKTENFEIATILFNKNTNRLIEAICGWNLHWEIEYTFYCKTQLGEFYENSYTYREKNTTINSLQDVINFCVREPALEKQNPFHVYDEGWKATILPDELIEN